MMMFSLKRFIVLTVGVLFLTAPTLAVVAEEQQQQLNEENNNSPQQRRQLWDFWSLLAFGKLNLILI